MVMMDCFVAPLLAMTRGEARNDERRAITREEARNDGEKRLAMTKKINMLRRNKE
jgi:hypothetical protein